MKCNDNGQIKYNLKINETKIEQKISTEAELVGADIFVDWIFTESTRLQVFHQCNVSSK